LVLLLRPGLQRYSVVSKVTDGSECFRDRVEWGAVELLARGWSKEVKEVGETPDLWADVGRGRELLMGSRLADVNNSLFTPVEQKEISASLARIEHKLGNLSVSGQQRSEISRVLGKARDDSGHVGRKDWTLLLYSSLWTLIVAGIITPEIAEHVFSMVIHCVAQILGLN
jgi:hypothetical protein